MAEKDENKTAKEEASGASESEHATDGQMAWEKFIEQEQAPDADYPPIDFNTFVLSLSTSALVNMGTVPDPTTGQKQVELPLARQTIDLLAVLEHKTQGNLTGEEERLLGQVLYDLRTRYMKAARSGS